MEQNQPAFPTSNWQKIAPMANGYNEGMTLRDYFAAKVLQAFESRKDLDVVPIIDIAKRSYAIADAMMKARTE